MKTKKHTFFLQFISTKIKLTSVTLFLILSVVVLPSFFFEYKINNEVSAAELRFTEISNDSNIQGSILPASCQSYPTMEMLHMGGDVSGHCSGTCPAPSTLVNTAWWRTCSYTVPPTWWDAGDGFSYVDVIPSGSTCPVSGTRGGSLAGNAVVNANVCRTTCWNGAYIFPHLGQTCPAAPCGAYAGDGPTATACTFNLNVGLTPSGSSYTSTSVKSPAGYTGSYSWSCSNGVWTPGAVSCIAPPTVNIQFQ